ncbi:hypothetical protein EV1_023899 [Malus domestica]
MLDMITTVGPSLRLLKLIVRCYMRLAQGQKDVDHRKLCLPKRLKDRKVINLIADNPTAMVCMRLACSVSYSDEKGSSDRGGRGGRKQAPGRGGRKRAPGEGCTGVADEPCYIHLCWSISPEMKYQSHGD